MIKHLILLLVSLFYVAGPVAAQDDLLDPDEAFAVSADAAGSDRIEIRWDIADGYYMYRDKIRFESDAPGVRLGDPQLPAGKVKEDEFFGTVETYREQVSVVLPVLEAPAGEPIEFTAHSQGCADAGVCYPPHQQVAAVELVQADGGGATGEVGALGDDLGLGGGDVEILDPEDAFRFSSEVDGDTIVARWDIAPNHYMYRDKLAFSLKDAEGVRLGEARIPEGERKKDEFFGEVEVFHDLAEARIPVIQDGSGPAGPVTLEATYQGCSEAGLCYPPLTTSAELTLTGAGSGGTDTARAEPAPQPPAGGATSGGGAGTGGGSDADRFSALLTQSSMSMVILYALGFGLLLAFTACMYPMIPILSSIIVGQGQENMSMGKGLGLASVYVGAMALTFGVIGGLMALFGGSIGIQAYFQSPWVLIPFAMLFVVLALGMFGFFNIQVPAAIQSRLSTISGQQRGGHLVGVGIMGSLSALIIGPCGGPVLIAALAYAAAIGEVGKGFIALFMLGVGMGLPLLVVGAGGGKLLPRAGTWMDVVKAVAGVILLAVAIVFLERMPGIFPPTLTMLLWATLFIVSAIYLGAMTPLPEAVSGWRRLWKGVGTVMLLYGFIVMLGGLTGGSSVVDPLHGSALVAQRGGGGADGGAPVQQVEFKTIKTVADLERELEAAGAEGKTVMLDFYADWCTYCKQFENYVFPEPAVRRALSDTVLLKADVTATDDEDKQLMQSVGVMLPPAILFFGPDGQEMRDHRIVGFMRADQFAQHVNDAVSRGSGQLALR